ncbi:MAG: ABC transporter ATP-binding protein [Candidatus Omnitrophica bacterium]|nr:ABC transporter ATP-binding protein [Candidatus Omnitrophota bacterium]
MSTAISATDLFYSYKERHASALALNGLTIEVARGEIFGFLGPNGAGKTTTIKLILGILRPGKGAVSVLGLDPSRPYSRASIGYMPENADYYRFMTPAELLHMYGMMFGIGKKALTRRIDELLDLVGLSAHSRRQIGTFSKGMTQKVSFAQALINDPELLVLDEPTGGLDPLARRVMRDVILTLKAKGKTIFFSSHELSEVEIVSDRIGILQRGRLVAAGTVRELLSSKGTEETLENYFLKIIEAN